MPSFSYKAVDPNGQVFTGRLEAADERRVVSDLHQKGYIPIRIVPVDKALGKLASLELSGTRAWFNRVSDQEVLRFTQELAALLGAGLSVDLSLKVLLKTSEKPAFKVVVQDVLTNVQEGSYLSDALARHPKAFPHFYVSMVRAGEVGGVLDSVLERMSVFMENAQEIKDHIKSAMIYPLFLVGVGGISIIILLTFVLPKFALIFADLGQAVPLSARALLAFSEFFQRYFILILLAAAMVLVWLNRYRRSPDGRYRIDRYKLKIPVIRDLVLNLETARFSRTLGTLINSGVPILQALSLVRHIIGNRIIADAMGQVYERVKEGKKLSVPLEEINQFPMLAVQMITVGEETGKLDEMLLRVGANYEALLKRLVKKLVSLLEPVMILVMGIVVGFIVISMLTAIFSINEVPF